MWGSQRHGTGEDAEPRRWAESRVLRDLWWPELPLSSSLTWLSPLFTVPRLVEPPFHHHFLGMEGPQWLEMLEFLYLLVGRVSGLGGSPSLGVDELGRRQRRGEASFAVTPREILKFKM